MVSCLGRADNACAAITFEDVEVDADRSSITIEIFDGSFIEGRALESSLNAIFMVFKFLKIQ
jgi:hypothetical protein